MSFKLKTKIPKTPSVNRDLYDIVKDYFHCSSLRELIFDILVPFILATLIFIVFFFTNSTAKEVLEIILQINQSSINIMAILAGFNTASVAVIASTNRGVLKRLHETDIESIKVEKRKNIFARIYRVLIDQKDENILKVTITFFSYAIAIQLFILIFGSIIVVTSDNIVKVYLKYKFVNSLTAYFLTTSLGIVWFTIILHSLFVSLRNVSLLYRYILFLGRNKE